MTNYTCRFLAFLLLISAWSSPYLVSEGYAQHGSLLGKKTVRADITAVYKSGTDDSAEESDQDEALEEIAPSKSKVSPNSRQLSLSYAKPKDARQRRIAAELKETGRFEELIENVNETFNFPKVQVVFESCEEANAYYFSEDRQITICYELITAMTDAFSEYDDATEESVAQQVMSSLIFTFFHELGHAAVDVFDLPITENEEDAVDRFATLALIQISDDDENLADSAIGSFDLEVAESLDDLDFADEHPVDEQRWYTMACLMVGSDPKKYDYLVGEDGLPEERAEACPAEYAKITKSWETLMGPHLKIQS